MRRHGKEKTYDRHRSRQEGWPDEKKAVDADECRGTETIGTQGRERKVGEKMSDEPTRRKKATYLSEAALASLREQLTKTDSKNATAKNGKLVAIGRQPWDSPNGRRVICLLCGIQLANLAARGLAHYIHLLHDHNLDVREYQEFCESKSWGRPPVVSLHARECGAKRRKDKPEEVKAYNRKGSKRQQNRLREDRQYRKKILAQRLARKQTKLKTKLTEAEWAALIPCPLCQREGHPEYRWASLMAHVPTAHEASFKTFRRTYPDAPIMASERKKQNRADLEAARAKQFGELASWQPTDWWDVPETKRIVASVLRREPGILNREAVLRLDEFAKCPYRLNDSRLTWTEYAKSRAGEVFFNRVRNWLKEAPGYKAPAAA